MLGTRFTRDNTAVLLTDHQVGLFTGRDHPIIAGLSFEVCASLPAISMRDNGFHPAVAVDGCGTFSHHKRVAVQ
ncbi:isochorismatase family protein [Mycobacterium florentinum]|uniref:isochorismatase family protein n=1 Tax=Mycobacterium florentinum TaxID=292462 RepID=UPI000A160FC7|nr:isochorismatase family protein [Mycobacterium florentinum]MCV7413315.1 isochorismatase family protein [Mycobacterium florentinum]